MELAKIAKITKDQLSFISNANISFLSEVIAADVASDLLIGPEDKEKLQKGKVTNCRVIVNSVRDELLKYEEERRKAREASELCIEQVNQIFSGINAIIDMVKQDKCQSFNAGISFAALFPDTLNDTPTKWSVSSKSENLTKKERSLKKRSFINLFNLFDTFNIIKIFDTVDILHGLHLEIFFFDDFQSYDAFKLKLESWSSRYPRLVKFIPSIGKTIEYRDIPVIHITDMNTVLNSPKPIVWIQGGQHAREWAAISSVMYLTNALIKGFNRNSRITNLLEKVEFIIIPIVNPDGYVYTWIDPSNNVYRLWRKNRRVNSDSSIGVDLNRNWGPYAFSEPETSAVSSYAKSFVSQKIVASLDVHTYGQMVLRVPGYQKTPGPNEGVLKPLGDKMAVAIKATTNNIDYVSMLSADLAPTGGGADDWFAEGNNVKYSYTIEMRPQLDQPADIKFLLPLDQIRPCGEDLIASVLTLAEGAIAI
ncbi:1116_t:CDS:2 [Ambispora gerdemannii]|uniref:1116_t:CDS:1 n=1 Tax=Ambispora gerdemannii TaxID=144530 RepID=A0A9N9CFC2_9GLOM|nr:1116_t:CDS:2 [Ambispora gerdemannii]